MSNTPVQVGNKYERLTVLARHGSRRGSAEWICVCECGTFKNITSYALSSKNTKSCGCLRLEQSAMRVTKHGLTTGGKPKIFGLWWTMIQRCRNPLSQRYGSYGGRGIDVCEEWLSFENFYRDMGDKPAGKSIDRINNDKGYSKENCRWVDRKIQMRNTRSNVHIEYMGKRMTVVEWAEKFSMSPKIIYRRLKDGWPVDRIFSAPRVTKRRHRPLELPA